MNKPPFAQIRASPRNDLPILHPPACFPHSTALTLPFGDAVLTANNDALHLTAMIREKVQI